MKKRNKFRPCVRRANGREKSESMRVAFRLAFYQSLRKPFFVMVQRGYPNCALDCGRSRRDVQSGPIQVSLGVQTFSKWSRSIQHLIARVRENAKTFKHTDSRQAEYEAVLDLVKTAPLLADRCEELEQNCYALKTDRDGVFNRLSGELSTERQKREDAESRYAQLCVAAESLNRRISSASHSISTLTAERDDARMIVNNTAEELKSVHAALTAIAAERDSALAQVAELKEALGGLLDAYTHGELKLDAEGNESSAVAEAHAAMKGGA